MSLIYQNRQNISDILELDDFWNNKNLQSSATNKIKIISYAQKSLL